MVANGSDGVDATAKELTARPDPPAKMRKGAPGKRIARALTLPATAIAVAAVLVLSHKVDATPQVRPDREACLALLDDDSLSDLVNRHAEEATAQLTRWDQCDPDARDEAIRAVWWDCLLIAAVTIGLVWAVAVLWRRPRWLTAGHFGAALAVVYFCADWLENAVLLSVLNSAKGSPLLPWLAAVKLGAILGALPVLLIAILLIVSERKPDDEAPSTAARVPETTGADGRDRPLARHRKRKDVKPIEVPSRATASSAVTTSPANNGASAGGGGGAVAAAAGSADAPPSRPDVRAGITFSGGGIRSAAFTLGALQALDQDPWTLEIPWKPRTELERCDVLCAVSGGSYMAAAWVTAREQSPADPNGTGPWERLSPEEDWLRRNSSYMAAGLVGKLWAIVWFLLGLLLNVGLIVLTFGVVMLPYGWLTSARQDERAVESGLLTLPAGGCLQLADGGWFVARDGAELRVASGAEVSVADKGTVQPPKEDAGGKASATAEGSPAVAVAIAAVTTTTTTAPSSGPPPDPATCLSDSTPPVAASSPAIAPGRLFTKGTEIPITAQRSVQVRGDSVAGCAFPATPIPPPDRCSPEQAKVSNIDEGSRLWSAPRASLTLDAAALVGPGSTRPLVRACNTRPCESFSLPWVLRWAVWILVGVFVLFGVAMVAVAAQDDDHRDRREHNVRWLAAASAVAVLAFVVVPWVVTWLEQGRALLENRLQLTSGASGGTILLALLTQIRSGSGRSANEDKPGAPKALAQRVGGRLRKLLTKLAAWVAGPVLLLAIALAFATTGAIHGSKPDQLRLLMVMAGWLLIIGAGADLNEWSLHPYYRDRLRKAYGTRVRNKPGEPPPPYPLNDRLTALPAGGPELVLCATANIADPSITAPGRSAIPWTFTRDCIGSMEIQAVTDKGTYSPGDLENGYGGLASVWTAVAVSGAAFSPGMGKMSRPERCLFAVANLRLGVWYPNPSYFPAPSARMAPMGYDAQWYHDHRPRPWYLAKEAFGSHKLKDPWVYVTDGGHYENLGLVELLRRRCLHIYCFDASGDSPDTFGTVADAMRLAREELGIEVNLRPEPMKPDGQGISRMGVWAGTVVYPSRPGVESATGWLVIAKLAVPRTAPFDVVDLARTLPSFPNHPTADQLYTDQKFEAYRALGNHLGKEAAAVGRTIQQLMAEEYPATKAVAEVNDRLCKRLSPVTCLDKDAVAQDPKSKEPAKAAKDGQC